MNTLLSGASLLGRNFSEFKASLSSPITKKPGGGCKTIASDKSEVGSFNSGKGSLAFAPGFMFKAFDSIYGARRIFKNITDKSNFNGSVRASVKDRVDYDFQDYYFKDEEEEFSSPIREPREYLKMQSFTFGTTSSADLLSPKKK